MSRVVWSPDPPGARRRSPEAWESLQRSACRALGIPFDERRSARPAAVIAEERTDVAAFSRQADALIAEARRLARVPPRGRRRDERERQRSAREDALVASWVAEFRAEKEGRRLGRGSGHDAFKLAGRLGVTVTRIPLGQLQNPKRPLLTITGRLVNWPGSPQIQIAQSLSPHEANRVVAHEIAHYLGFEDERLCDYFAAAFVTVEDNELPGFAWRQFQAAEARRAQRQGSRPSFWRRAGT